MSIDDQTQYTREIGEYLMNKTMDDSFIRKQVEKICAQVNGRVDYISYIDSMKRTCKKITITYDESQLTVNK